MDADDNERYNRRCGFSVMHNDEEDKCESFEIWGEEHHECVCNDNDCNGADAGAGAGASRVVAFASVVTLLAT